VAELRALANPANVEGMARFGISPVNTLAISIPTLRAMAKRAGATMHSRSNSGTPDHEARILPDGGRAGKGHEAPDGPLGRGFDSWDVVDGVCDLFVKTPYAYEKAHAWGVAQERVCESAPRSR